MSDGACEARPPAVGKEITFRHQVLPMGTAAVLSSSAPHTLIS